MQKAVEGRRRGLSMENPLFRVLRRKASSVSSPDSPTPGRSSPTNDKQSSDKKKKKKDKDGGDEETDHKAPTHTLSLYLGTLSKLEGVSKGAKLRFTVKILGSKSKLDFDYAPGCTCFGVVFIVITTD